MSHKSDNSSLSQPLRVETEGDSVSSTNSNFGEEDKERFNGHTEEDTNDLGPLPPKWEKAYTESGEVYFIDHSTGTSHWLDPRLSKFQKKSLEDCMDDELPYGWEKISDPHYGIYFIDHVNRRTQYENPVIQAKRAAAQASTSSISRLPFTKDPVELCGQRITTSLVKSSRGLGFTIIGGDDGVDEFLQIKSVVPKGPAWLDGKLEMGDVIVYVNDICVLGYTHNQIVRLFQSISVGSTVSLEVCRGYPLPFDPNDPNTEVVTTIAVDDNLQVVSVEKQLSSLESKYNFLDRNDNNRSETNSNQESVHDIDNILKEINKLNVGKLEVTVKIVKGNLGFGFTIADSACGQRVKKILDRHRCKNLQEGDILLEINNINLQNMTHDKVVQVLKNCPYSSEATICVQRNYCNKNSNIRNKPRKNDNRLIGKEKNDRSKTPTADIYCTQTREVLPARPKTPLIDTRHQTKSPVKDLDHSTDEIMKRDLHNENFKQDSATGLRLSLIDNTEVDDEDLLLRSEKFNQAPPYYNKFQDCHYYDNYNYYKNVENGSLYDFSGIKKSVSQDWWVLPHNSEYIETAVTLNRHDTGFGFRIIGGIEDRSQTRILVETDSALYWEAVNVGRLLKTCYLVMART
ncbi:membrane-associated guanylate kinase, WW and PDZ domain-containing protein 2 isoform X2 [Agrilus planipennis]|uniref:Membrane-associated guanylate kinase, WW and PDZ domain-containing protein 2 isoform X2 n=1 Tax=Agrilus planipennis TaxID=224129 RepID=A0A1W4WQ99_AGRPL|nr:membrane-associated guanylate kinase, WW and PDZ domain-containing protein 2 isoform X2 [Agrilus planipennis]